MRNAEIGKIKKPWEKVSERHQIDTMPVAERILKLRHELARLLGTLRRPGDEIARLGGDEFVLVLEGIPAEAGRMVAERLRRAVHEHRFEVGGRRFDLGVSVGVVPVDGRLNAASLLALADSALYSAKERGRNRVVLLDGTVAIAPGRRTDG